MPDSKSGIKHISNMASMHQNIFLSLQNVFSKQFKSNMKIYSKEMNVIKEDLVRLRREKERYLKQDESYKRLMDLSTTETNSESEVEVTRKEAFAELRRQNSLSNRSLTKKVNSFSGSTQSRPSSDMQIDEDSDINIEKVTLANRYVATGNQRTNQNRKPERERSSRMVSRPSRMEDVEEMEEDEVFADDCDTDSQTKSLSGHCKLNSAKYSVYKPNFGNDRFVNTTVNNARAKLTSLYRQAVLGPSSNRKNISLILPLSPAPSRPGTEESRVSSRVNNKRTQSAAATKTEIIIDNSQRRKSKSAHPQTSRKSSSGVERRRSSSSRKGSIRQQSDAENFDPAEQARLAMRKREKFLSDVKEGLNPRYNDFEQALHRRMMIREMKAAEYDANHTTRSNITLQEVIPSKASATGMSDALRRQSAIIALERSIMGGV